MNLFCSEITNKKRNKICNNCEFKRGDFKIFGLTLIKRAAQCKICKCSIFFKTKLKDSKCPKNKW